MQGDQKTDDMEQPFDNDRNPALAHQKENQKSKLQKQKQNDKKSLAHKCAEPFCPFFQNVLRFLPADGCFTLKRHTFFFPFYYTDISQENQ